VLYTVQSLLYDWPSNLTRGLHDGLVPGHRGLQSVEGHGELGRVLGTPHRLAPRDQATWQPVIGSRLRPVRDVTVLQEVLVLLLFLLGLCLSASLGFGLRVPLLSLGLCFGLFLVIDRVVFCLRPRGIVLLESGQQINSFVSLVRIRVLKRAYGP
jgi:hypothetical protein